MHLKQLFSLTERDSLQKEPGLFEILGHPKTTCRPEPPGKCAVCTGHTHYLFLWCEYVPYPVWKWNLLETAQASLAPVCPSRRTRGTRVARLGGKYAGEGRVPSTSIAGPHSFEKAVGCAGVERGLNIRRGLNTHIRLAIRRRLDIREQCGRNRNAAITSMTGIIQKRRKSSPAIASYAYHFLRTIIPIIPDDFLQTSDLSRGWLPPARHPTCYIMDSDITYQSPCAPTPLYSTHVRSAPTCTPSKWGQRPLRSPFHTKLHSFSLCWLFSL